MLLELLNGELKAQDFRYATNNGSITITGYTGPGGTVTIPDTIDGLPVTGIQSDAFKGIATISSVAIPDSVTTIGDDAFYGCGLTTVSMGGGTTSIGNSAFSYCSGLLQVSIPNSVTNVGPLAFFGCTSLTNVEMGNRVRNLSDTFDWCGNLPTITLPESITNLYNPSFACSNLTRVYFRGDSPAVNWSTLDGVSNRTIYYLPGTKGWSGTLGGFPAVLWNPMMQTRDPMFGVRSNQFGFTVVGTADTPLVFEACIDLAAPSWVALQSCTLTNGSIYFGDPRWTNYPSRVYRIRSP